MISKKIYLPALTLMILGSTMFVVSNANAEGIQNSRDDLVQAIAQKFNLNQSDVQQLFDDYRQQQQNKRQNQISIKLDQAVKDSKITQSQKDAILAKLQELRNSSDHNQFKNQTPAERQQDRKQRQADLQAWASQNGLSLATLESILRPFAFGFGRGHFQPPVK